MAQSVVKTWVNGDILTHTDLNAMNTNILSHGLAVISPLTGHLDCGGYDLISVATVRLTDTGTAATIDGALQRNGLALSFYDGTRAQVIHGAIPFQSTIVGNIGAGEDDLMTLDLGADFFTPVGRALQIDAGFHFAANANTKTLRVRLGASTLTLNTVTTAPNNIYAMASLRLARTGANTQEILGRFIMSSKADPMPFAAWTETSSSALTFKFTGQSGSSVTNDVRQFFMAVALVG